MRRRESQGDVVSCQSGRFHQQVKAYRVLGKEEKKSECKHLEVLDLIHSSFLVFGGAANPGGIVQSSSPDDFSEYVPGTAGHAAVKVSSS
jgi:hypothetical protein